LLDPLIKKGVYEVDDTFLSWGARWDLMGTSPGDVPSELRAWYFATTRATSKPSWSSTAMPWREREGEREAG